MSSKPRAPAGDRAQRAGCTGTFTPAASRAAASEQAWLASSLSRHRRDAPPSCLLTASICNSTTPKAPIWNETSSQAQLRTAKSLQSRGLNEKQRRARGSQRPDLSPVRPQRRRSSAPGAVKTPRGPKIGAGTKPARTQPPAAQRPALLQGHYLRTPLARIGPAAGPSSCAHRDAKAILQTRRRSALSVAARTETKLCARQSSNKPEN